MTRPNANFISPATIVEPIFQYTEKYEVIRRKYLWFSATSPIHSPVFCTYVRFFFCSDQFQVSVGVKFCFHRYNLVLLKQWTHLSNSWTFIPSISYSIFVISILLFLSLFLFIYLLHLFHHFFQFFFWYLDTKFTNPNVLTCFFILFFTISIIFLILIHRKKKMALLRISSWV